MSDKFVNKLKNFLAERGYTVVEEKQEGREDVTFHVVNEEIEAHTYLHGVLSLDIFCDGYAQAQKRLALQMRGIIDAK